MANHQKEMTTEQLNLIKAEAKKLDKFFDQEWNKLLNLIAKDIDLEEFSEKFHEHQMQAKKN